MSGSTRTVWSMAAALVMTSAVMISCSDDDITGTQGGSQEAAQIAVTVRSDANIMGVMHTSNLGEITAGTVASTKAADAEVKAFATQMVNDHTTLDAQGNALAASLAITPVLPDNQLPTLIAAESDTLNTTPAGNSFDRVYMASQVRDHVRTLALIDASILIAQDAQLRALLQNVARPSVAMHLQMAQTIQARIGTP
jgi:putative membrane protein